MANKDVTLNLNVKTSTMGKLGAAAKSGLNAIQSVGNGSVGGAIPQLAFLDQIANIVSKANPQAFQRWMDVLEDIAAIVGDVFTPILEVATDLFRMFADILQEVMPLIKEFVSWLAGFAKTAIQNLNQILGVQQGSSYGRRPGGGGSHVGIAALGSNIQNTAWTAGGGSPQQMTADNTAKMVKLMEKEWGGAKQGTDAAIDGTRGAGGDF